MSLTSALSRSAVWLPAVLIIGLFSPELWSQDAAAKNGGEVVLCAGINEQAARAVVESFEARTGIAVVVRKILRRGGGSAIAERLQDARGDVWWSPDVTSTVELKGEGMLARLDPAPEAASLIPAAYHDPGGCWFGFSARARILIVNTELVPEAQRPRSIWDVVSPKWAGKTAFARPGSGTARFFVGAIHDTLGEEQAQRFLRGVEESGCILASGDGQLARLVGEGAACFGLTDTSDYNKVRAAGLPVTAIYPDQGGAGTMVIPNTLAVLDDAPNPGNARKLLDYLLGGDAEAILAAHERGQTPLKQGVEHPPSLLLLNEFKSMKVDLTRAALCCGQMDATLQKRFPADEARRPSDRRGRVSFDDFSYGPPGRTEFRDFEEVEIGAAPAGMVAELVSLEQPAPWSVVQDQDAPCESRVVMAETVSDRTGRRSGCVLLRDAPARDVSASVYFKSGEDVAGLAVRYQDRKNFYYARFNPQESNIRLYLMRDGKRVQIGEVHHLDLAEDEWHVAQLDATGDHLAVLIDGRLQFEVVDASISAAGRVGIWSVPGGVTRYDGLSITTFD